MGFNTTHIFETSLDIVGITLSCVIISYLIYNRIKYNQMVLSRKYKKNISTFKSEVAVKMNAKYLMMMMEKGHLMDKVINVRAMDEVSADISSDPFDEISKLAGTGLGVQKISKKVGVPPGEVELYLKLNKNYTLN